MQPRKWSSTRSSVNLFLLAMMNITSVARDPVTMTGYTDDWTIFARHSDFDFNQNELQCTVKNMIQWANDKGFRFSSTKTVCIHFCRLRIALGAFRSTRIENLICEAGSSTLNHRRLLITAKTRNIVHDHQRTSNQK
jgi:hypothetical protein